MLLAILEDGKDFEEGSQLSQRPRLCLAHSGCSLLGLSCVCCRARGSCVPAGNSAHLSRDWDGASSAHSWPSWGFPTWLSVPRGFQSRALLVTATQPSFGITQHSQRTFLGPPSGQRPASRHTQPLSPSSWTLLPAKVSRGGQERGPQVTGNRPCFTHSTPLHSLGWDVVLPG